MEEKATKIAKANEGKKIVSWHYDRDTSKISVDLEKSSKAELESQFSFKLERYKDSETHEESMKITNYKNGIENGEIVTSILDLASDITKFKKFGVVIGDSYFRDLVKQIELVYLDIHEVTVTFAENDGRLIELFSQIKEYVTGDKDLVTDGFCYIPVAMFNDLAGDCGYRSYEMKTLREQLHNSGYIKMASGRYAILKRIKDKPERVVAFYREKLGVEVSVKQTKTATKEKSDTDEK